MVLARLVTGCWWEDAERPARSVVSNTTARERRDKWIAAGYSTRSRTRRYRSCGAGLRVLTDGWTAYGAATADGYTHERYVAPGPLAHKLLPSVHRVISLSKR